MSGINPTTKPVQPLATDDINTLLVRTTHAINAQARLGWAFAPSAQDTPNMTVAIAAGAILSGSTRTEVSAQSTATITAPATHPRIDLVVVDKTTGAVSVVAGAEGASPSEPALPAGKLPVALVALSVGMTAITNSDITDVRVGGGSGPELEQNLLSPSADAAPSTQAVVDALERMRDMAAFHAFVAQISAARSSGPIPGGYMWMMATDELATKTNANYDSSLKAYANFQAPSYSNTYGTGNRTASISVASNLAALYGTLSGLVNGSFANDNTNSMYFTGDITGSYIEFTFPVAVNITEAKWYQSQAVGVGTWKWQGWTGSAYVDIGNSFTLGGSAPYQTQTELAANTGYYTKYRLLGITGYGSGTPWNQEIEFKVGGSTGDMTLIPTAITASAAPAVADLYLLHQAVDAVTLGTDLKLRASADNGANWSTYATITEVCQYDSSTKLLKASVTLPTSGTSLKWELTTYNAKKQRIKPVAMQLR